MHIAGSGFGGGGDSSDGSFWHPAKFAWSHHSLTIENMKLKKDLRSKIFRQRQKKLTTLIEWMYLLS
jgi:hypothetical protein